MCVFVCTPCTLCYFLTTPYISASILCATFCITQLCYPDRFRLRAFLVSIVAHCHTVHKRFLILRQLISCVGSILCFTPGRACHILGGLQLFCTQLIQCTYSFCNKTAFRHILCADYHVLIAGLAFINFLQANYVSYKLSMLCANLF